VAITALELVSAWVITIGGLSVEKRKKLKEKSCVTEGSFIELPKSQLEKRWEFVTEREEKWELERSCRS